MYCANSIKLFTFDIKLRKFVSDWQVKRKTMLEAEQVSSYFVVVAYYRPYCLYKEGIRDDLSGATSS